MSRILRFSVFFVCVVLVLGLLVWFVRGDEHENLPGIRLVPQESAKVAQVERSAESQIDEPPAAGEFERPDGPQTLQPADVSSVTQEPTANTGVIAGRVFDTDTGQGVLGLTLGAVPAGGGTVTKGLPSELDGAFTISGLSTGLYDLQLLSSSTYVSRRGTGDSDITVKADQTSAGVEFGVTRGAGIRCKVIDTDQKPVEGADVTLAYGAGAMYSQTGPLGLIEFDAISFEEVVSARARKGNSISVEYGPVTAEEASTNEVLLVLEPGASIAGQVVDVEGRPVGGAYVAVRLQNDRTPVRMSGEAQARADGAGAFRVEGLGDGVYDIVAEAADEAQHVETPPAPDAEQVRQLVKESLAEAHEDFTDDQVDAIVRDSLAAWDSDAPQIDFAWQHPLLSVTVEKQQDVTGIVLVLDPPQPTETLPLAGHVVNEEGQPIAGAVVQVLGGDSVRQTCGDDGAFRFGSIDCGNESHLMIFVSHPDYSDADVSDVVPGDEDILITMRRFATVRGHVIDAQTGAPVEKFQVGTKRGYPSEGGIWDTENPEGPNLLGPPANLKAFFTVDGTFELNRVDPGSATVNAISDGHAIGYTTIDGVAGGASVDGVVIRLDPAANLPGRVTNRSGQPVPGASLFVISSGAFISELIATERVYSDATSSSDGTFMLTTLLPGDNTLLVVHPSYAPAKFSLSRDMKRVDIQLTQGGSLLVEVTYGEAPVSGAQVSVMRSRDTWNGTRSIQSVIVPVGSGISNQDGLYTVERLLPGPVSISAHFRSSSSPEADSFFGQTEAEIMEGQEVAIEVELSESSLAPAETVNVEKP